MFTFGLVRTCEALNYLHAHLYKKCSHPCRNVFFSACVCVKRLQQESFREFQALTIWIMTPVAKDWSIFIRVWKIVHYVKTFFYICHCCGLLFRLTMMLTNVDCCVSSDTEDTTNVYCRTWRMGLITLDLSSHDSITPQAPHIRWSADDNPTAPTSYGELTAPYHDCDRWPG